MDLRKIWIRCVYGNLVRNNNKTFQSVLYVDRGLRDHHFWRNMFFLANETRIHVTSTLVSDPKLTLKLPHLNHEE